MNRKRLIISIVVAVIVAGFLGIIGAIYPQVAKGGGLGDFYKYKTCYPVRNGDRLTSLKGVLSNYDIHNFADQRYHHGVKISAPGWYLATAPLYDDESWPITKSEIFDAMGWSGYKWDGTQDFGITSRVHTITYIFSNGKISAKCTIKI